MNNGIDISDWQMFSVKTLFDHFENGMADGQSISDGDNCLYLGAKKSENCVMRHCAYDESITHKGNCIVFICNGEGSVGYANYIDRPFIASKDLVMDYANWMNERRGLFVATVLCLERPKYSFGRKWKRHLMDTCILLPAKKLGDMAVPDWDFMDTFIGEMERERMRDLIERFPN